MHSTTKLSSATQTVDMDEEAACLEAIGYNSSQEPASPSEWAIPLRLASDYFNYKLTQEGYNWQSRPNLRHDCPEVLCSTLRALCDDFETRLPEQYQNICESLDMSSPGAIQSVIVQVCDEIFHLDGIISWGRIVAVFFFGGAIALQCWRRGESRLVFNVAEWTASYIEQRLEPWVRNHGGGEGLVKFYETRDTKASRFIRVMIVVGLACGALGIATLGLILAPT